MSFSGSGRAALAASLLLAVAAPAAAQSLFATGGLGLPSAPLDARARALGTGVGLLGVNTSLINPAEVAGLAQKGFAGTLQPVSRDIAFAGGEGSLSGSRFPVAHLFYPVGQRLVVSLGYGSFLEQSWSVESETQVDLAGQPARARDVHRSEGGVAQARLGAAYTLTPTLVLGAAVGLYTGELTRSISRTFPDSAQALVQGFTTRTGWVYSAPLAVVGVRWDPVPGARVGASVAWSGELEANGRDDAPDHAYALPMRVDVGASGTLSPRLALSVGGGWAPWGGADGDGGAGASLDAHDAWQVGGGLEWTGIRGETRTWPVRAGYHQEKLPFPLQGGSAPSERSFAFGVGLRARESDLGPGALVDATLERGTLSGDLAAGGELSESFWRVSISLALFGN